MASLSRIPTSHNICFATHTVSSDVIALQETILTHIGEGSSGSRGVGSKLQQSQNFRRRNSFTEQVALPFRAPILLERC
jgi:hypothetical protein